MPLKKTYNPFDEIIDRDSGKPKESIVSNELSKYTSELNRGMYIANNKKELIKELVNSINASGHLRDNKPVTTNFIKEGIELYDGINRDTIKIDDFTKHTKPSYIGGKTDELSRINILKKVPKYTHTIDSIENIYKLPKNILKTTLGVEGVLDYIIRKNNDEATSSINSYINKKYRSNPNLEDVLLNEKEIFLPHYGYDISNEKGEFEKVSKYLKEDVPKPLDGDFTNEKSTIRKSGYFNGDKALEHTLHLKSAKLAQLKDKVLKDSKKHNISLNDEQLSYWINAYWNTGEYNAPKIMINNKGNYVKPTPSNRVTLGSNGEKFLRQYREFLKDK